MKRLTLLAAAAALSSATAAEADTAGAQVSGGWNYEFGPYTMGFQFTADQAFALTALGAYDMGGDGLLQNHQVGIWDSNGALLASVTVTSAATLLDGFRYTNLSPLTLGAGTYRIAASNYGDFNQMGGDPWLFDASVTMPSGFHYQKGVFANGTGLLYPGGFANEQGYFGANFRFQQAAVAVPEPGSWALMLMGFGAVGFQMGAKRRVARRPANAG